MNDKELEMTFNLLCSLHPRASQFRNSNVRRAWGMALEPFSYDEVQTNILSHARTRPYPPDIHDLTKHLRDRSWMKKYLDYARSKEEPTCATKNTATTTAAPTCCAPSSSPTDARP